MPLCTHPCRQRCVPVLAIHALVPEWHGLLGVQLLYVCKSQVGGKPSSGVDAIEEMARAAVGQFWVVGNVGGGLQQHVVAGDEHTVVCADLFVGAMGRRGVRVCVDAIM